MCKARGKGKEKDLRSLKRLCQPKVKGGVCIRWTKVKTFTNNNIILTNWKSKLKGMQILGPSSSKQRNSVTNIHHSIRLLVAVVPPPHANTHATSVHKHHGEEFVRDTEPRDIFVTMKDMLDIVQKGGVCIRHGAKVKTCSTEGCTNQVVKGGVCVRHGAKVKIKTCSQKG